MRFGEKIGELRQMQIARVRQWAESSGKSQRAMAEAAGLTGMVFRGFERDDWSPAQATLDSLELAAEAAGHVVAEPLVSVDLSDRQVDEIESMRPGVALAIWASSGGHWTAETARMLGEAGVMDFSTVVRDTEHGLLVEDQGEPLQLERSPGLSKGRFLLEREDIEYDRFVHARISRCLMSETPVFQRSRGWCGMAGRNLRWTAALLPFRTTRGGPFDRILSACLPEAERLAACSPE